MKRIGWPARSVAVVVFAAAFAFGCSSMYEQPDAMQPGDTLQDCPDCPQMVVIPAGTFVQGSNIDEDGHRKSERPQHQVTIEHAFAVGKYEVTQGEFRQFVEETDRDMDGMRDCWDLAPTEEHPVACVNWNDAKAYVQWLAEKTGKPYRLLSETEWEYAARSGTTKSRFWGNGEAAACKYAHVAWCGADDMSAPVGQYRPNSVGLYDMLGNVWEWVDDCWNESYEGAPSDGSAWSAGNCDERVLRGGSFYNRPHNLRSAIRNWNETDYRYDDIGLRVGRSLP